ncbi:hypothetical protein VTK56DRAFT_2314 [Thermocarpiscus australiensis]
MASYTSTLGRTLTRSTLRRTALPLSLGLTSGLVALHNQRPLRLDSYPSGTTQSRSLASGPNQRRTDGLDAETVRQLSGGSLSGFVAGLLVSVFSKTLVLLAGIAMVLIQVRLIWTLRLIVLFVWLCSRPTTELYSTLFTQFALTLSYLPSSSSGCRTQRDRLGGVFQAQAARAVVTDPGGTESTHGV